LVDPGSSELFKEEQAMRLVMKAAPAFRWFCILLWLAAGSEAADPPRSRASVDPDVVMVSDDQPATLPKTAASKAAAPKAAARLAPTPAGAPAAVQFKSAPVAPQLQVKAPPEADELKPSVCDVIPFKGVRPGVSHIAEVAKLWGDPLSIEPKDTMLRHTYACDRFKRVEVTFYEDKVLSIVLHLERPARVQELLEQLDLLRFEPVEVTSSAGKLVGLSIPERSTALSFVPGHRDEVSHVVFDCPDSQPFVLRAASRMAENYTGCLEDLACALELDPQNAEALSLKASVLLRLGQAREALATIEQTAQHDAQSASQLLVQSKVLAELSQYDQAREVAQRALAGCGRQSELKARVICELADQLAAGPQRDYKSALDLHLQAIQLAEPLVTDSRPTVRQAAREIRLDAYLAAANDIAWGDWKSKDTVVPKWLERAKGLTGEFATQAGQLEATMKLCRKALSASVGMKGALDPAPWIEQLSAASTARLEALRDPVYRHQVEWELGLALYDSLQAYQMRGDIPLALKYGLLAASHLEKAIELRHESPLDQYLLGRLYFRMGSMQAINNKNHRDALVWFDKAWPAVTRRMPTSAWADPGRQGETLVSMAVSYWAAGQPEKALQLTRQGVEWMEQAVGDGVLDKQALSVPYSNLSAMHRYLGEEDKARGFAQLADRMKAAKLR
jgi:tetratricopeptide (TPR) repeat protein